MIQLKTMVNCIDNSGAAIVECVNVLRSKRPAKIGTKVFDSVPRISPELQKMANTAEGDRIIVVVQKQRNFGSDSDHKSISIGANKVRRGDIRHAVVVRTAKKLQRPDGSVVRFDDNACVLINKAGEPIGTRLNGVVGQELRGKKWSKILSLAPMHV